MNYMNQIAQMLGVELDEEFYLESIECGCYFLDDRSKKATFKLSLSGMMTNYHNDEWKSADECLVSLLEGAYTIVKKPRKPKKDEKYYYVSLRKEIVQTRFYEAHNGVMRYQLGNYFRTEEEITPKVLEETWQKCYGAYFQDDKQDGAQQ